GAWWSAARTTRSLRRAARTRACTRCSSVASGMATTKRPTFAHRVEYALLRIVAAALSPLSLRTASSFGALVGGLGYWPLRIRAARVERYIRAAFPEFSEQRVRAVARESYRGLGRVTIEGILLSKQPREKILEAFSGTEGWE